MAVNRWWQHDFSFRVETLTILGEEIRATRTGYGAVLEGAKQVIVRETIA
jgi:hypothetical protein